MRLLLVRCLGIHIDAVVACYCSVGGRRVACLKAVEMLLVSPVLLAKSVLPWIGFETSVEETGALVGIYRVNF